MPPEPNVIGVTLNVLFDFQPAINVVTVRQTRATQCDLVTMYQGTRVTEDLFPVLPGAHQICICREEIPDLVEQVHICLLYTSDAADE